MTTATQTTGPFSGRPVEEVPLDRAPLVRVLAQVRFEHMAVFKKEGFETPFVERLLEDYPLLEEGREAQIIVGSEGVVQKEAPGRIWRLRTIDKHWMITLSAGSLAIETNLYESRREFIDKFERMCATFVESIGRSVVSRLGVRYTNQTREPGLSFDELVGFLRPDIRGGLSVPRGDATVRHAVNDTLFAIDGQQVQGRWGILPENTLFDPGIPAVAFQSWFLDIDCFSEAEIDMTATTLRREAASLSERAYGLFRWFVTPEFMTHFGAT